MVTAFNHSLRNRLWMVTRFASCMASAMFSIASPSHAQTDPLSPTTAPTLVGAPLALQTSQDLGKPSTLMAGTSQAENTESGTPAFGSADQASGTSERETILQGNAEIRRQTADGLQIIRAEKITYWNIENEVLAQGKVTIYRAGDVFTGPELRLKIDATQGYFLQPEYQFARSNGRGRAERIDFLNREQLKLTDGLYTTCPPEQQDWWLTADSIEIDRTKKEGVARGAVLRFLDTPILATPYLSFPLDDARKSGFLAPVVGLTTKSGADITLPYYWNIAPNYDATLYPRVLARRGMMLGGEFRYLGQDYQGELRAEYLGNDRETQRDRYSWGTRGQFKRGNWSGNWDANRVSDDDYFRDLSRSIVTTSQLNIPRDGVINYNGGWWNSSLRATRYQTLQDRNAPITPPYERLPQWLLNASGNDVAGFDWQFSSDYTQFAHPTLLEGSRWVVAPSISYPIQTPGFFLTPKLTLHTTRYQLDAPNAEGRRNLSRTLPMFSLDTGLIFERDTSWFGSAATQTFEPRLFYLRTPYRNQDNLPNFDTGIADFNFAQIFSENIFSGQDRIADANQLTVAGTTRWLSSDTGAQLVRITVGQRFSFKDPQVFLEGQNRSTFRRSDFLLSASGQITPKLQLDYGLQYNPAEQVTQRTSFGMRYQPEPRKVINTVYRYTRETLNQFDVSAQWPLSKNWYGVGRINYSLRDSRLVEMLAGLEYDTCCWMLRLAAQRFAVGAQQKTTAFFIQLELKGLGGIGSSPLDVFKRNVPGYSPLNQTNQTNLSNTSQSNNSKLFEP